MAQKSSSTSTSTDEAIAEGATRDETALNLVNRFALWAGVAGLIPIPLIDVAAIGGLQIQMVRRLSQVYDVDFSENRTKAIIASLAGSLIPATSGIGAASLLKGSRCWGRLRPDLSCRRCLLARLMPSARRSFSTLRRAARCSISTRRIIGSSSEPSGTCGIYAGVTSLHPAKRRARRAADVRKLASGSGVTGTPGMLGPGRWRDMG